MFDRMTRLAGAGVVAALVAVPALAQQTADWDTDQDQAISAEEFEAGWSEAGVFDQWDRNDDDALDQDEVDQGIDAGFDADGSGDLGEDEQAARDASQWADADIAAWDGDASLDLSREEFANGVFTRYDADASGDWSGQERPAFETDAAELDLWND